MLDVCFEPLFELFNGIYVRNKLNTEYRDVKRMNKLKMNIRTGLDILIFHAKEGLESWIFACKHKIVYFTTQ